MEEKQQPWEKFPKLYRKLTLPMTGLEVYIRKLVTQVYVDDGLAHTLSNPAMKEVVASLMQETKEAGDYVAGKKNIKKRPVAELPIEALMQLEKQNHAKVFRAALAHPKLDVLLEEIGGDDSLPDLGMGDDFTFLNDAINAFSEGKAGEAEKTAARTFPNAEGGPVLDDGGEVRAKTV